MTVLVLIGWYAIGFLAAAHLVRRGHDRTLWTLVAALTGGLVAIAAVVATSQRALRPRSSLVTTRPPEVAVVVERQPHLALSSLARLDPAVSVTLVGLVSHEAHARWVDTGERAEVERRFAAHRSHSPLPSPHTVLTGAPSVLAELGARLLVLARDRDDRSRRHDAWRVLSAARSSGAAVLSPAVPHTASTHRPAARVLRETSTA